MRAKNHKDIRRNNHQYMRGITFIALNDDNGSKDALDPETIQGYISTVLLSEVFQVDVSIIALDVIEMRQGKL